MKSNKYYKILILLLLAYSTAYASDNNNKNDKLTHQIIAGFNIGGTTPIPLPREIRSLNGWWPQFTPQLGYNIIYTPAEKWGFGSGILLDYKGMGARDRVKYMHTRVRLEDGGRELEGYFVGKNETRVKIAYVTIPFYAVYNINKIWNIRVGGYASYAFSSSFKGKVWDGYLRVGDPTGEKIELYEKEATFDFGDDIRSFDFGLTLGTEMKINERFGVFGNLNWGLQPIFKKNSRPMDFDMYNIYFAFGLTYKL